MELDSSVHILSALAHASRLTVFRMLVQAGEAGLPAGEIARRADIVPSTLSTHLAVLTQAGLILARRNGRLIIYTADYARMRELLGYLLEDCCAGAPEVCAPLVWRFGNSPDRMDCSERISESPATPANQ